MCLPIGSDKTVASTTLDWLVLLRLHTKRFGDILTDADPAAPVPSCPGWSLRDLAGHLGGVHQWAAHAVVNGNPNIRPELASEEHAALPAWYRRHASHLIEVLTSTPMDSLAWTLDERDPTAKFWGRRQVHETVMHTWDAENALGQSRPIDPVLAWDGVLEVRDIIYPRQVRLGRVQPLTSAIRMTATDVAGDVAIGEGDVVMVRAKAEVLLRLLWHRAAVAEADSADPRAEVLLSTALTP
jgi:uncharacterized protein (TIGR03083 family)